jgi:hypothetical protein
MENVIGGYDKWTNVLAAANKNGANKNGANKNGANKNGANKNGANKNSANKNGANKNGANKNGANKNGANKNGANKNGANKNSANSSTKKRLPEVQDSAMKILISLLRENKWVGKGNKSRINEIHNDLENFDWLDQGKERKLIIRMISDELKALEKTKYSFANLEAGSGLHELRSNLKWIVIERRVLSGLFIFNRPNKCEMPQYRYLVSEPIAVSKYSTLKASELEPKSCKVDQCVFLGLVDLIDKIGNQKDIAEAELNANDAGESNDLVPERIRKEIHPMYENMVRSGLVGALRKQINSCD